LLGEDGRLQKEAPYITYTPEKRLLLSPLENATRKLEWAERRGGGLAIPFIKEQMQATVALFEQLVGKIPSLGKTENETLANKIQLIIDEGVGKDARLAQMWQEVFPTSL